MNKQVLIICESHYRGQTLKIAKAMAGELRCDVVDTAQAQHSDISTYDIIGFGSGIFFGRHEPRLLKFVDTLAQSGKKQKAFVFSTRGNPMPNKYHQSLKRTLAGKGWLLIGEFSCKGYDCTGPYNITHGGNKGRPNESDERRARKFIRKALPDYVWHDPYDMIAKHHKITKESPNQYTVASEGVEITLVGDTATVNHHLCTGCGICQSTCPNNVYEIRGNKAVPAAEPMCIQCRICQERCPEQAITIHSTIKSAFSVLFHKRETDQTSG